MTDKSDLDCTEISGDCTVIKYRDMEETCFAGKAHFPFKHLAPLPEEAERLRNQDYLSLNITVSDRVRLMRVNPH